MALWAARLREFFSTSLPVFYYLGDSGFVVFITIVFCANGASFLSPGDRSGSMLVRIRRANGAR
jgi:hypothetical protein